jgi:hypothetical protein
LIPGFIIYIILGRVDSSIVIKSEYLQLFVEIGPDVSPGILLVRFLKWCSREILFEQVLRKNRDQIKSMKDPPIPFLPTVVSLLAMSAIYLILHGLLPPEQGHSFFWAAPQFQWVDWLYWSMTGAVLNLLSIYASQISLSPGNRSRLSQTILRIIRDVALSLVVLFLINYLKVTISGLEINLRVAPAIGACLAFVFGFYGQVTQKFIQKIIGDSLKRVASNIHHRITGNMEDRIDEETYIQRYIEPKLQPYYLLGAATQSGREGHQASHRKLVRYKSAKFVGNAGFTLNAIRTVFIGPIREKNLPEIIAHEACHVAQGYWSDSIKQEIKAYITGVKVNYEINNPNTEIPDNTAIEWLKIEKALSSTDFKEKLKAGKRAEEKVRKLQEFAPLYGIIPVEQKVGFGDFLEMIRQGGFLIMDAIGLRNLIQKLSSITKINRGGDH